MNTFNYGQHWNREIISFFIRKLILASRFPPRAFVEESHFLETKVGEGTGRWVVFAVNSLRRLTFCEERSLIFFVNTSVERMFALTLAVLVVIAHPDDETLFAGFLHALTHKLQAKVDLVCVTNGAGGFRHSAASGSFYGNLDLSNESIAREYLPRIRQEELLASGKILGIRRHFFYDQLDLKYTRDVELVLREQWNRDWIIQLLDQTLRTGNGADGYDLMLIILPNLLSHGHHSASAMLALESIARLQRDRSARVKIPLVIGGSEFVLNESVDHSAFNRLAQLSSISPNQFRFDRRWKLSNSSQLSDYQMIVLWTCSAHKSQGGLLAETSTVLAREHEQYFSFALNDDDDDDDESRERSRLIPSLFKRLTDLHE